MSRDLPEWSLPYFQENYTGPYLSDGKIQSSVAYGKAPPRSKLDILSRAHDTSYKLSRTERDRRKADSIYYAKTRTMSVVPRFMGDLVYYVNDPSNLLGLVSFGLYPPGSSMVGGGVNMGNENGRERAQRLRKEINQRDGSSIDTSTISRETQPGIVVAPIPTVYKPNTSNPDDMLAVGCGYYDPYSTALIRRKRRKKSLYCM